MDAASLCPVARCSAVALLLVSSRYLRCWDGLLIGPHLDYMVHHFGSSEDYDKLARDSGDNTLSWRNMKKYIFKVS